ncbi:MAG TPA: DUF4124 domain-containing protein [Burkholderiales bacterium]|jgi:hypothetical protein|nr:DUF4124 domain-containing protein [Burkholderiales bacterium]
MNTRSSLLLCAALAALAAASAGAGEIFKWTDAEGHVHFSDSVPREAEKRARPVTVHEATAAPRPVAGASAAPPAPGAAAAVSGRAAAGAGGGATARSPGIDRGEGPQNNTPAAKEAPTGERRDNRYANDRSNYNERPDDGRSAANHADDHALHDGRRTDDARTTFSGGNPSRTTGPGPDEAGMRAFLESAECYAQFTLSGGRMKPGAAEACGPPVPDPRGVSRR